MEEVEVRISCELEELEQEDKCVLRKLGASQEAITRG